MENKEIKSIEAEVILDDFIETLPKYKDSGEEPEFKIIPFKYGDDKLYQINVNGYTVTTNEIGRDEFLELFKKKAEEAKIENYEKLITITGTRANPHNRGPKITKPKKKRKNGKRRK